jgi:hypothetical protein
MIRFWIMSDPSLHGEDHPSHPRKGIMFPSQWSPAYPLSKWPGRRRPERFWK